MQLAGVSDHDELSAAFDEVKALAAHLGDKGRAADFTFHIVNGATNDAALGDGLGREKIVKPGLGKKGWGAKHLRAGMLPPAG